MSYTYKFLPAALGTINKSTKDEYIDMFEKNLEDQFYQSSDVWEIQEETTHGSGVYQSVDARITRAIDATTTDRISDDYRKLLFKDLDHSTSLGWQYQFDDNIWITTNIDKIKSLTTAVTVRRCNNVLRWYDENGGYYEVPCAISYLIKENRDYSTAGSNIVVPSGMIECVVQYNEKANKIKPNQRFLFGNSSNWISWRVEGGGINNFLNRKTSDNTSAGFITLSMAVDYVNEEEDDLVNGVANHIFDNAYTIELNQTTITGSATQTRTLQAVVRLGTSIVNRTVTWSSSDTTKATVNSSGVVTFVANGSAIITCSLENNPSVYDSCAVTVSATPSDVYQIVYTPEQNNVLESTNVTWTFTLYKNGVAQADAFTFVLNPRTVPSTKYTYLVVDNNNFIVQNLGKYVDDYLTVTATSGAYSKALNIFLRGVW